MDIHVVQGSIVDVESDALIVNLFDGVTAPGGATGAVDRALGGMITAIIEAGEIRGKLMETALIHTMGRIAPKRVLVVGLGKREEFGPMAARRVSAAAIRALRGKGVRSVTSIVHGAGIGGMEPQTAAQALIEGTITGAYKYDLYKSEKEPDGIDSFSIVESDAAKIPSIEAGAQAGRILGEATNASRATANEPSNVMTPTALAEVATRVAGENGLDIEILGAQEMEKAGMRGILSVAKGSAEEPKLIIMRYRAEGATSTLALVGKGVTFDSGGISIKPSDGMSTMKFDMCGASATIHAMAAIAQMKPAINVTCLAPAVENMPSGTAYRPGDVITCYNGKTVEITTTDAEGRMILSDAIAYAAEKGANYIVDIATLTGGCVVALGYDYTGLMGNDPGLMASVKKAADAVGERVWELPLPPDYMELIKSQVADMTNAGGRGASAIQGGLFLKEFAGEVPWVHMDIAGPADISGSGAPPDAGKFIDNGATGVGLRTMVTLASLLAGK